jgi:hypothetical protein
MKKKNLYATVLLIAAAMWCFVSCGSGEKTTETAKVGEPVVGDAAAGADECSLTVYFQAAASFTENPVITEVDLNGSTPGNPPLEVGEKVNISPQPATTGVFVGVQEGKPVTIKVKTDDCDVCGDSKIATFTIPCADTSKATVDFQSDKYSVKMDANPGSHSVQFNFQPKVPPAGGKTITVYLQAAASFTENPVITEVDYNGSVEQTPCLCVGEKVSIANQAATPGLFVGVLEGKPVTVKVKLPDDSVATLTIPFDPSQSTAHIDPATTKFKVDIHPMPPAAVQFNFAPR